MRNFIFIIITNIKIFQKRKSEKLKMSKIAFLGDIYADIQTGPIDNLPKWGCDQYAPSIKLLVGGSASNTARYAGRSIIIFLLFTNFIIIIILI